MASVERCLDEEEVIAFSQGLASRDTQLLVEQHIDDCARCFAWVANMVHTTSRDNRQAIDSTAPMAGDLAVGSHIQLNPGQRLSRYEIVDHLGSGSMGIVYRAYDPALRRYVALKLIRGGRVSAGGAANLRVRLLAEAHALAQVTHPNVVTIYDIGFIDEQIFIAMELIEGTTLREWITRTKADWRQILDRYLDAAAGLVAAHASGLVHRDFKPDNVLVSGSRVVVTDFGLVCAINGEGAADSEQVGTPAYMAPEQFRGETADQRTDIFNFCAALYESLFGKSAFAGNSTDERRAAVLSGRLREPPVGSKVPRWLRALLLRGMARDRSHRPSSMAELIEGLQHDSLVRRRRLLVAGVVMLVGVGAASAGVTAYHSPLATCERRAAALDSAWSPTTKQGMSRAFAGSGLPYAAQTWRTVEQTLDRYVNSWREAHLAACRATYRDGTQSAPALDLRLACLDERQQSFAKLSQVLAAGEPAVVTQAVSAAAQLEPVEACADMPRLAGQPVPPPNDQLRAKVRDVRHKLADARGLELAGKYDDAAKLAAQAVALAHASGYAPPEADARFRVAAIERDQRRWSDAERDFVEAMDASERGRVDLVRARAAIELVEIVGQRQTRLAEGERWAHQAEVILERVGSPVRDRANLIARRGMLRLNEGKLVEAEADLRMALDLRQHALAPDDPLLAYTMEALSLVLQNRGKYVEAETLAQRALSQLVATYGADHPEVALVRGTMGNIAWFRGRLHDAKSDYEQALVIETRTFGEQTPTVAKTLSILGGVCDDLGEYEKALKYEQRALAINRALASNSASSFTVEVFLSHALEKLGRFAEAKAVAEQSKARSEKVLGPEHLRTLFSELQIAHVELAQRHWPEALRHAEAVRTVWERQYGVDYPKLGDPLEVIGTAKRELGKPEEAVALQQRALKLREQSGETNSIPETLTVLGVSELAAGRWGDARRELERAIAMRKLGEVDPRDWAWTAFGLARALRHESADSEQSTKLATQALDIFAKSGAGWEADAADVRRWLRQK